jgi:integrase
MAGPLHRSERAAYAAPTTFATKTDAARWLTAEEAAIHVDALAKAIRPHLRALVLVGFWGHLRLGELLGLERADVDLDEGTVRVKRQVIETDEGPVVAEPKAAQSPNGVPAGAGD